MMRATPIFAAAIIYISASALAQTPPPKAAAKPHKQPAAMGCKLVGTVKGTKLWAGDCTAPSELRGSIPTAEPTAPAAPPEAPKQ